MRSALGRRRAPASTDVATWQPVRGQTPRERGGEFAAPKWLFWVLLAFFVLEFARPGLIVHLRLQMLAVLVLPLAWLFGQNRPWGHVLTGQVLFLGLCVGGILWATNNYAAYFQARVMFGNVAMAVAISWVLADLFRFQRAMWVWVAVMLYASIWTITHGGFGPGGFIKDENDVAQGIVTALPFALYGFEQLRGWRRWLCVGVGIVFVSSVVVSSSRGGFVALGVTVAYWVWASRHRVRNGAALMVAVALFIGLSPSDYKEEMLTIRDTTEGTALTRRFLWVTAVNMWQDNPVLGVGAGNFNFRAGEYQPRGGDWPERLLARNWSGTTVHSTYFQALSELGLAGALLLAVVIGGHFAILRRLRRDVHGDETLPEELRSKVDLYSGALAAGMVGFMASGAFLSTLYYPYPWYLSGMTVAFDVAVRREMLTLKDAVDAPES